jgi:hypothetical protein
LFPRLEAGEADATLVPVHRFDAYRIEHPDTKLAPSGYFLPVGFNMGFVGLARMFVSRREFLFLDANVCCATCLPAERDSLYLLSS